MPSLLHTLLKYPGDAPNYYPNSFAGPEPDLKHSESKFGTVGDVARYETGDEDNYSQVTAFWKKVLLICSKLNSKITCLADLLAGAK